MNRKIVCFVLILALFSSFGITTLASNTDNHVGLIDGETYYLINHYVHYYLKSSPGTTVYFTEPQVTSYFEWTLDILSSGSCHLISSSKALTASASGISLSSSYSSTTNTLQINRVSSGSGEGMYTIKSGSYYIAVNEDENLCVTTTLSDGCYWSFGEVDFGSVSIFGSNYFDTEKDAQYNTSGNFSKFSSTFSLYDYTVNTPYLHSTARIAYDRIKDSDVFIFHSHGDPGIIYFHYQTNTYRGKVAAHSNMDLSGTAYYISDMVDNQLASSRCVLYIGCSTGESASGVYNLVDETFDKGARFVLGVERTLHTSDNAAWLGYFLDAVATGGCSAAGAASIARIRLGEITHEKTGFSGMYPSYTRGDTAVSLGFNPENQ